MIDSHTHLEIWKEFFFATANPLPMALVRIGVGLISLVEITTLWHDAVDWFGETGLVARYNRNQSRMQPLSVITLLPDSTKLIHYLFGIATLASASLLAGFFTNASALVLFVCWVTLFHRNPYIEYGADQLLKIALFILILSDAGGVLSVDAYISTGKFYNSSIRSTVWPTRLLQLQVLIVYAKSFYWKQRSKPWLDGEALTLVLSNRRFSRGDTGYLLDHPSLTRVLNYAALATEALIPMLLLVKQFWFAGILVGVCLHLTISYFLRLHLFGVTMIVLLLVFIPL